MNKEKILRLADYIEQSGTFDMSRFFEVTDLSAIDREDQTNFCGTVACIAGHALMLEGWGRRDIASSRGASWSYDRPIDKARLVLDLTIQQAQELFFCTSTIPALSITKEKAAAVLRHFARTGKIDWSTPIIEEPITEEQKTEMKKLRDDFGFEGR
jgi:hypothetical protein